MGLSWPWPKDPDIWWHLKTGEWMVNAGTVMRADPFGAYTLGVPVMAPSWLAEMFFYFVNKVDPVLGLRFVQALVVAITTTILMVHAWMASRSFRASLLLCFLFLVPMFPWVARPQIFSFMFVALTMFLLWLGQNNKKKAWWMLPPLVLLWANLHVYFIVGLGLMFLVLGTPWLAWLIRKRMPDQKPPAISLVILALSLIAPLGNPYGYHLYEEIIFMVAHASSSWAAEWIMELQSPSFQDWPMKVFLAWVAIAFLAFLWSRKRPSGLTIFLFFGLLYQSLQHRRDVPYFLIVMLPVMAEHLAHCPGALWARAIRLVPAPILFSKHGSLRYVLHWALLLCALVGLLAAPKRLALVLPTAESVSDFYLATRYMLREKPPSPIYNSLGKGGYLIYSLWPSYHVFIDGRTGLYSDADWQQHNDIRYGRPGWHEKLVASKACTVIWERNEPLASLLQLKQEWSLVYEDKKAVIFVRKQCL